MLFTVSKDEWNTKGETPEKCIAHTAVSQKQAETTVKKSSL